MSLYNLIGRLIGPFRVGIFVIYSRAFHVPRARVLLFNESGELLLVRVWGARRQWELPGGGVKSGESFVQAARREVREEVGIDVDEKDFVYVTTLHSEYEAPVYALVIRKIDLSMELCNPREITDLRWFARDMLPADRSPLVSLALTELSKTN